MNIIPGNTFEENIIESFLDRIHEAIAGLDLIIRHDEIEDIPKTMNYIIKACELTKNEKLIINNRNTEIKKYKNYTEYYQTKK